jgi:hypothetical protein
MHYVFDPMLSSCPEVPDVVSSAWTVESWATLSAELHVPGPPAECVAPPVVVTVKVWLARGPCL